MSQYDRFANGLECSKCGTTLRREDLNLPLAIATCSSCGAVLDLKARLSDVPVVALAPAPPAQSAEVAPEAAPMPEKFVVVEAPGWLEIRWRWFSIKHLGLAFFAAIWNAFLVTWYRQALGHGGPSIMVWFPLLHVAAGVGMTYWSLAGFFNRTRIRVSHSRLEVRHGPLPWLGGGSWYATDFTQLYVERRERGTARSGFGQGYRSSTSYDLCAKRRDGRKQVLLRNLDDAQAGLWLERTLERRMGIEPHRLEGAVND